MKTIRETIHNLLFEHCIWDDEADAIIETAKADKALEAMKDRWDDDLEGYPKSVLAVTWISVKRIAIEWLKERKPNHFALFALDENYTPAE